MNQLFTALEERSFISSSATGGAGSTTTPTSEAGAEQAAVQQPATEESTNLEWEGWGRNEVEATESLSVVEDRKRRSLSRSSDEERDPGRGGQRAIRRRGRTPSPQAGNLQQRAGSRNGDNRGGQTTGLSSVSAAHLKEGPNVGVLLARQQIPILGSTVGLALSESEEYNPEDPAVPELQQRQLRSLIPSIGTSPLPPPPGPPPGLHHTQHPHMFSQGLQHGVVGGMFPAHLMQSGPRHQQHGIKSQAEIQMMLRSQLQAQMMQRSQMQMSNSLGASGVPNGMGGIRSMPLGGMGSMGGGGHGSMSGMGPMSRPSGMGAGGGMGHMNGNGVGGGMMAGRNGGMGMGFGGPMGGMMPMGHMMPRGGMMGMDPSGRMDGRGMMGMALGGLGSPGPGNGMGNGQGHMRGAGGDVWGGQAGGRPGEPPRRGGGMGPGEGWDRDAGEAGGQDGAERMRGDATEGREDGRGEAREGRGGQRGEAQPQWKAISDTVNVTSVPEEKCNEREVCRPYPTKEWATA